MHSRPTDDWTQAWIAAPALALSSWTRDPRRLAEPESARLLSLILELTLLESRLALRAWIILPGAIHLVADPTGRTPRPPLLSWPAALGRIKGLHARCDNRRRGTTGSLWRPGARIRPLRAGEVQPAVLACEQAPVRAGLCERAEEWPFSSVGRP